MENISDNFSLKLFIRDTIKFYFDGLKLVKNGLQYYWKYSLLLLVMVGVLSYYKLSKIETYYTAKTSYTFNFLHKKVFGDLLYDIELLCSNKEYQTLSTVLDIPLPAAQSILTFQAKNIVNSPLHEDFTERKVPFYIWVTIKHKESLPVIQKAITNYLVTSPFSIKSVQKKHQDLKKRLALVNNEIQFLDSIKVQLLDTVKLTLSQENMEKIAPLLDLHHTKVNLKTTLEEQLIQKEVVSLLKPFQAIKHARAGLLTKAALKYSIIYLFLSLSLTTVFYWYKQTSHEF
ncbi:hypothetical protein [Aureispira anguillae]|uniref:Uncharacterized protein n=1 Tax=Aureispira anguillae TaxID=2864201 RepID=A0A915VKF0_9BACT|nr:hypothetical protein [Aureispira anguillae]BDS09657.1 hypothetical protein AsAng_0003610 [Aureispira anguillae]